jgi:hypothetical protein
LGPHPHVPPDETQARNRREAIGDQIFKRLPFSFAESAAKHASVRRRCSASVQASAPSSGVG